MKRLYQLATLSLMAGAVPSFAQGTQTILQKGGLHVTGQMLALHVTASERVVEKASTADIKVSGQVMDEKGNGLPGVSVVVKGSTKGSTTDEQGNFQIVAPNPQSVLVFSFVGYQSKEVVVGNQTTLRVSLEAGDQTLNESHCRWLR